jgi:hypothetical protein
MGVLLAFLVVASSRVLETRFNITNYALYDVDVPFLDESDERYANFSHCMAHLA